MSRQDKATTDRHARILRDLVKQPDNKNCADCRKNDARWASWNLGVYVCIRCSGIHRSMGTHISKVKSIDLDIWTPEQMENIQKWGNKRANLYWEKHLKVGHVPPDHKIESFIRSKYESRRWAMEGPLPSDPSMLENGGSSTAAPQQAPTPTTSAPPAAPASLPRTHPLLSRTTAQPKPTPPAPAPMVDLFGDDGPSFDSAPTPTAAPARAASSTHAAPGAAATAFPAVSTPGPTAVSPGTAAASQPRQSQQAQQKQQQQQQQSNIFDLDFRTPTPTSASSKPQTAKADIMSLFSTASPMISPPIQSQAPAPVQNSYASWQGGITSSAPPQPQQTQMQNQAQISGGWGMGMAAEQNAWGNHTASTATNAAATGASGGGMNANPWGGSGFGGASAASGANAGMGGSGMSGMTGMSMGMGADPWASPAPTNQSQGAAGGHGGFGAASGGAASAAQKKAEHDPFANIWQ